MIRAFLAAALFALLASPVLAQSSPNLTYGQVPTPAQWNQFFIAKQDTLGFTPLNVAGGTMAGPLVTAAPSAAAAGLTLPPGAAPSGPNNGDLWTTSAGLYARINGSTVGPLSSTVGTVTSVGLALPGQFTISGSPVTSTGTLTGAWATQSPNIVFAGPTSGGATAPTFRSLVGADLPNPVASTLGGVKSLAAVAHLFLTGIATDGTPTAAQPAFTDISGTAQIAQGGTGQVTANAALNALLPSQASNSGKALLTDGSNATWQTVAGTGTVTSVTCNGGLSGGAITISGTCAVATNGITNALSAQMATSTIKGNASTSTANAADLSTTQVRVLPGITLRGQLFGLALSNDSGTPASVIDTAVGEAASDDSSPNLMVLGSAITKSIASAWVVGSGNGCLDTGAVADGTYHIFLIQRPDTGVVDELCSISATAPTMPTNYTEKRRIGSIVRASASIVAFVQDGDRFYWNNTSGLTADYNASTTRAKAALTVNVPSGIRVEGIFLWTFGGNAPGITTDTYYDGVNTNISKSAGAGNGGSGGNGTGKTVLTQFTNTSAQIQFQTAPSGGGGNSTSTTLGWIDTRGR